MKSAVFRFYAELNDFLQPAQRFRDFSFSFESDSELRRSLQSLGVPTELVDLVLVNGESAEFSCTLHDGDRISVFPVFESFDITPLLKVRETTLRRVRFVLDVHLGKLARSLRMLGFDSLYRSDYTDRQLLAVSENEGRVLLSRDRALLLEPSLVRGYCVKSDDPVLQLAEVVERFDLSRAAHPFTRCMCCNMCLLRVPKEQIAHRLPPRVAENFDEFQTCPECHRIYWKGSHFLRMREFYRIGVS